eukprot:Lithocolla_globosa_v1_NODE_1624_length_2441_cov_23.537301.p2 type:complete len:107 gc:universal NODE_1624_length_2441_cov_23.537301:1472-1792(+)
MNFISLTFMLFHILCISTLIICKSCPSIQSTDLFRVLWTGKLANGETPFWFRLAEQLSLGHDLIFSLGNVSSIVTQLSIVTLACLVLSIFFKLALRPKHNPKTAFY